MQQLTNSEDYADALRVYSSLNILFSSDEVNISKKKMLSLGIIKERKERKVEPFLYLTNAPFNPAVLLM